jgi:aspartate dehydrogenase
MSERYKLGLIGYGYLGKALHQALGGLDIEVSRVFNRSAGRLAGLPESVATTDLTNFVESCAALDLVVEVAHPDITVSAGASILKHTDYMPCSVGALANDQLREELIEIARSSGTRLLVPHGAVVGVDNLIETRDNWKEVVITFRKPPESLGAAAGSPADETVLFEGSVREAAAKFPRNVNAMVACALATVGVDATVARVIADRRMNQRLRGEFSFIGRDGSLLTVSKEEPAVGVSSPGIISALKGSVLRALAKPAAGLDFV